MAAVWLSRFSRWLEALNNAKGGAVLTDINPELQAVALIQEGNESRYLQGWNRYGIEQAITGTAGQTAGIELHNPLNSNVIAVVERISVRAPTAAGSTFLLTWTPGPAGIADFGVVQANKLDGRQNTNSSLIFSQSTSAVGFAYALMLGAATSSVPYNFIQSLNTELVLIPGSALIVVDQVVAELAIFDIAWRERVLQTSELT